MTAMNGSVRAPAAAPAPRAEWRVAVRLALVAALAYLPFNHCHFSGTDETGVFNSARAIVERGELAVEPGRHIYVGADGRHYAHFAVGQSLLVAPLVALGEAAGALLPEAWIGAALTREDQGTIDTAEDPVVFFGSLYAPLASGALVGLFYLLERGFGASRRSALVAAALFGACSYAATLSVFFLQHTTEAILMLGSLGALHGWRRSGRVALLALGVACACAVPLVRVPAAISGPALAGYLAFTLLERRRSGAPTRWGAVAAAVAVPTLALAAAHIAFNTARWGTWLASPMLAQSFLLQSDLGRGLHGLLLSPGAGLFAYSPLLLLLPMYASPFCRAHRAESIAITALVGCSLLLYGRFTFWHGLWAAPGPRYLASLVPFLMLPFGLWLDAARPVWQRWLTAALAALGLCIQLALMSVVWRRVVELMGYEQETRHWGFLFEPLRGPIAGAVRALAAGEVDLYLWALGFGVPGREPQPLLAAALLAAWAALFAVCWRGLRRAMPV